MQGQEKTIKGKAAAFIFELAFFSLAQILGIFSALKILEMEKNYFESVSFWGFVFRIFTIILFVLFLIGLLKFRSNKSFLFKVVFVLVASFGGFMFFSLWIGEGFAFAFVFILLFLWIKFSLVLIHNFLILFGIVGMGSIFGLRLEPQIIVFLLIIFSIYDFIAVYKTKHMTQMARAMIGAEAVLGLILPLKISGFKASLRESFSGGKSLVLGGGDIVFPLLLCVSLVSQGIFYALIVAFFASMGVAFSFYIFIFQPFSRLGAANQPIPALPPIALFSIIGYVATLFF